MTQVERERREALEALMLGDEQTVVAKILRGPLSGWGQFLDEVLGMLPSEVQQWAIEKVVIIELERPLPHVWPVLSRSRSQGAEWVIVLPPDADLEEANHIDITYALAEAWLGHLNQPASEEDAKAQVLVWADPLLDASDEERAGSGWMLKEERGEVRVWAHTWDLPTGGCWAFMMQRNSKGELEVDIPNTPPLEEHTLAYFAFVERVIRPVVDAQLKELGCPPSGEGVF